MSEVGRRPHRPRAGILDPVGSVAALVVEASTLHQTLNPATTPQAAFDALADAHHHLVIALRLLSGRNHP